MAGDYFSEKLHFCAKTLTIWMLLNVWQCVIYDNIVNSLNQHRFIQGTKYIVHILHYGLTKNMRHGWTLGHLLWLDFRYITCQSACFFSLRQSCVPNATLFQLYSWNKNTHLWYCDDLRTAGHYDTNDNLTHLEARSRCCRHRWR